MMDELLCFDAIDNEPPKGFRLFRSKEKVQKGDLLLCEKIAPLRSSCQWVRLIDVGADFTRGKAEFYARKIVWVI